MKGEGLGPVGKRVRGDWKGKGRKRPRELGPGVMENVFPEETDDVPLKDPDY